MMRALMLTTCFLASFAAANELPDWHLGTGRGDALFKGPFTQLKKTKFLRRPIKSSGTILLSKSQGIAWQTESPVKSTLVLTPRYIINIDSDNKRKKLSGGSDLNMVFLNALTGNWTLLERHFQVSAEKLGSRHCITLEPNTELTRQSMQRIKVCGNDTAIDTMHIEEVGGSTVEISMTLAKVDKLDDSEQQLFINE